MTITHLPAPYNLYVLECGGIHCACCNGVVYVVTNGNHYLTDALSIPTGTRNP